MKVTYDPSSQQPRQINPIGVRTNMIYDGVPSVIKPMAAMGVRTSMMYCAVQAVDEPIIVEAQLKKEHSVEDALRDRAWEPK